MQVQVIPPIGLGTFDLQGRAGLEAMNSAIGAGYRHFDTAQSYGTEENVGKAIRRSGIDRREFFITTKITAANLGRIERSLDESLQVMGLDYVDMALIHWPAPDNDPPVCNYIGDLARAQDRRKTRMIGVSNFTRRLVDEAIYEIGGGRLATNQFERHVFLQNRKLARHCRDADILVTAYMPLARGGLDESSDMKRIARKHGATPEQIGLAWLMEMGSVVIPKSANPDRQVVNLAARDVRLDERDMAVIAGLDCGRRYIDPEWGPTWD